MNIAWKAFGIVLAVTCGSSPVYAQTGNARLTPVVKVVRDTAASVVNISTEKIVLLRQNPFWGSYGRDIDDLFDQFFGRQAYTRALRLKSVGSGVIVDRSGLVVTNAHVVNMASNIFVILNDGTQVDGRLVYENQKNDLALVRISLPKSLPEAKLGKTDDLMLGETVVAIGNPLGLENSVSAGILSGKNRELYSSTGELVFGGLLQVDAPINPGSSGGALFNLNDELIGINVAVIEFSQSVGFAIPVEKVRDALSAYKENKDRSIKVSRAVAPSIPARQWEPLAQMQSMPGQINWNIEESSGGYTVKVDTAGFDKDKVDIKIDQGAITVTAERSTRAGEHGPGGSYNAQSFSSFVNVIPLPQDAGVEGIRTEKKGDILLIHIPKKEAKNG